ncbi:MAG: glycosyltransferase family 9 protein [Candidatus Firestonebacteria bacterium]
MLNLSVIIFTYNDQENIKRCLETVKGWVKEIIIIDAKSFIDKKYIEKAKGEWVLFLNADEEVSIPLKIEIRQVIPGTSFNEFYIPVISNITGEWKKESDESPCPKGQGYNIVPRLIRKVRYESPCPEGHGFLKNPIRHYVLGETVTAIPKFEVKKILIIKLRGIGDTVILTPVIRNLKKFYKKAEISVLIQQSSLDVLKNNPYMKHIFFYEGFIKTVFKLMKEKFDLVICPQSSFKTALLGFLIRAKIRVVSNHNGRNYFSNIVVQKPQEYESALNRDLDCLRALGIPIRNNHVEVFVTSHEKSKSIKLLKKHWIKKEDVLVGFGLGASKEHKIWFKERFAVLSDELIKRFNCKVIFFTDPLKEKYVFEISNLMKNKPIIFKELKLRDVISVISRLDLFIGNDSGLAHISVGLNVPSIVIVGSEEPKIFHPYLTKDKHCVISKDIECKPCWKKECEIPLCLDLITVNDVLKVVRKLIQDVL